MGCVKVSIFMVFQEQGVDLMGLIVMAEIDLARKRFRLCFDGSMEQRICGMLGSML